MGEELTWSSTDIVESKLRNTGVELEEEGQWLSNSTGSTEDGDLGELDRQMLAMALKCDPHGRPSLPRHGGSWDCLGIASTYVSCGGRECAALSGAKCACGEHGWVCEVRLEKGERLWN
jgi:hypothetical protein